MDRDNLFNTLSDPNHPVRQREWDTFLQRRQELYDDLILKTGLGAAHRGNPGLFNRDPITAIDNEALLSAYDYARSFEETEAGKPAWMRNRDYQQLLGSAMVYGIPDPDRIPVPELMELLEERRQRRRTGDGEAEDFFAPMVYTGSGPVWLGAADALVRSVESVLFAGDYLSETKLVESTNQWLGMLREASYGGLSEEEMRGVMLKEAVGGIAGYIPLGIAGWKLAGQAMGMARIGGFSPATTQIVAGQTIKTPGVPWGVMASNPILHRSVQGGLATFLLEAGGDAPIEEKALNIVMGTALGAAFEIGGPIGMAALGGTVGGIVGASVDETPTGIGIGIASGLALNRLYRLNMRRNSYMSGNYSNWQQPGGNILPPSPPGSPGPSGGPSAATGAQISGLIESTPSNPSKAPLFLMNPEARQIAIDALDDGIEPSGPVGLLGSGVEPGTLQIPSVSGSTKQLADYVYSGPRTLLYAGDETPEAIMKQWSTFGDEAYPIEVNGPNLIELNNTGRITGNARNVYEVEAGFNALLVITPENAPLLRQLVGEVDNPQVLRTQLRQKGFDGIAFQGFDDLIMQAGPEVVAQHTMLPPDFLRDRVIAFGFPGQVSMNRPVVNGELLDGAIEQFGIQAGQQVAGVQAVTLAREAAKNLSPFQVGPGNKAILREVPVWLSEQKGVRFISNGDNKYRNQGIESAVLQHSPELGPRVVLLDGDQIAKASIPVESLEHGTSVLAELGFKHMDPNDNVQAIALADELTNLGTMVNNEYAPILGQIENPSVFDLIAAVSASNPGRVSVVKGIPIGRAGSGRSEKLLRRVQRSMETLGLAADSKNTVIFHRNEALGTVDALIGPRNRLDGKVVEQYAEFGVFTGMRVQSGGGIPMRVNSVWKDAKGRKRVNVSPLYSEISAVMPLEAVMPGRITVDVPLTKTTFKQFKKFALAEFNSEAVQAGMEPAKNVVDPRVMSFVDKYIERFGARNGITSNAELREFANSLEVNLVDEIRLAAGDEGKFFNAVLEREAAAITKQTMRDEFVLPQIEDLAHSKGLIWEPPYMGKPGQVIDTSSNLVIPFDSQVSAELFIRNFEREISLPTSKEDIYGAAFQGFKPIFDETAEGIRFAGKEAEEKALVGDIELASQAAESMLQEVNFLREQLPRMIEEGASIFPNDPRVSALAPSSQTPPLVPPGGAGGAGGAGSPPPPPPPSGGGTAPPPPPPPPNQNPLAGQPPPRLSPPPNKIRPIDAQMLADMKRITSMPDGLAKLDAVRDMINRLFTRFTAPTRIVAQMIDEFLLAKGVERPTVFQMVNDLANGKGIAINRAAPWVKEWNSIMANFPHLHRRSGRLYSILTADSTPDPAHHAKTGYNSPRDMLMDLAGYDAKQKQAVQEARDFYDRLWKDAKGSKTIGYIYDYLPRLKHFANIYGERGYHAWGRTLPDEIKWFAEYARTGQLNTYILDVDKVTEAYIRGLYLDIHTAKAYSRVKAVAEAPEMPEPLQAWLGEWLYIVRHGHPEGYDAIIRSLTATFNGLSDIAHKIFGTPPVKVLESEVLQASGIGFTTQYRSALGGKPSTNFRELYQPFLLVPEFGLGPVLEGYRLYLKDPKIRALWTERAIRRGWAEPNRIAVGNSEFFTGELRNAKGLHQLDSESRAAREQVAQAFDKFHDMLPASLKGGITGTRLDPLTFYQQFAVNPARIVAANIGYEVGQNAIARHLAGEIDMKKVLSLTGMDFAPWSRRQNFIDHMNARDWNGAAGEVAEEATSAMYHFGVMEQAAGIRGGGTLGRAALQFTNFTFNFAWRTARRAAHAPGMRKASYLAALYATANMPGWIGREIGWEELKNMNWFRSLMANGGTMLQPAIHAFQSGSAARKSVFDEPLSPEERFSLSRLGYSVTNIPINPYAGVMETAADIAIASQQPQIVEAMSRALTTGVPYAANTERFNRGFVDELLNYPGSSQQGSSSPSPDLNRMGLTPAQWEIFMQTLDTIQGPNGGGAQ
jgi:hypothetical protein